MPRFHVKKSHESVILFFKSMTVTICLFLFFGAMFVAMNETQKSIDGRSVSVALSSDSMEISVGEDIWVIEKNETLLSQVDAFLDHHAGILPLPVLLVENLHSFAGFVANLTVF